MRSVGFVLFVAAVGCLGIAWSIYFYSHMDTMCQHPFIGWTKECIGYSVQHQ